MEIRTMVRTDEASRYDFGFALCLAASKSTTAAAFETLSEFIFPYNGIDAQKSQFSLTSLETPVSSPPSTKARPQS